MKAVVLGASGFLGQAVTRRLWEEKWHLRALVHRRLPQTFPDGVQVMRGALDNVRFEDDEIVFHCARLRGNGRLGRRVAALRGRLANRKIVRRLGRAHLVYASGSLMYGDCGERLVLEDAPLRPTSYAREYVTAERPFLKAPVMMFRPGWILGPGSWLQWFYLQPAEMNGAVPLYGSGRNLMSIIHREDCAGAMIHVAQYGKPEVYHPPSTAIITQREFVEQLASELHLPIREVSLTNHERATREAFECSIHLGSRNTELWKNFAPRFSDLKSALEDVLAASKARIHQNASRA